MKTHYKIERRRRKTFVREILRLFNSIMKLVCNGKHGFYILKPFFKDSSKDNVWKIRNIQKMFRCKALTLYINNSLSVLHWEELIQLFITTEKIGCAMWFPAIKDSLHRWNVDWQINRKRTIAWFLPRDAESDNGRSVRWFFPAETASSIDGATFPMIKDQDNVDETAHQRFAGMKEIVSASADDRWIFVTFPPYSLLLKQLFHFGGMKCLAWTLVKTKLSLLLIFGWKKGAGQQQPNLDESERVNFPRCLLKEQS